MRAPIVPPPVEKKRKKRRSWILSFLGWSFAFGVVAFVVGSAGVGFVLWKVSQDLPKYDSLAKYEPPVMTRIHANNGLLMAEYAHERRIFVPINTIPKLAIAAFLSAEDKRFYEHGGIDIYGLGRAVISVAKKIISGSRKRPQGASTITQQVAKNFLLEDLVNKKNKTKLDEYTRKLKEAILAIRIERAFSKDKILELYLNEIFFGVGSYGIAAAALNYFGKELDELGIEEVAYLASLPKAPNNYHPFRHTKRATARRNWIIGRMTINGYISQEQADEAIAKPLTVNLRRFGTQVFAADYFAEEVRRSLVAKYGKDGLYGRVDRVANTDLEVNGGLSVRTTLDARLQKYARRALIDGLVGFDRGKGWRGPVAQIDIGGDWGVALRKIKTLSDIQPWRIGVVLEAQSKKVVVGLAPQKDKTGKIVSDREAVEISFKEMKWARKKGGRRPRKATDVVQTGDVIYVAPKDPEKPQGAWSLMQIPEVGGGILAMDPHTGRVLAVVGGFSFAASQFDRAMQAKRQPGSAFKPIVYATALDNGYKPTSIVLDAPISISQGAGKDVWEPKNYGGKYWGPTTLRTGIERSRNLMTVRLAQDMGMPLVAEYARRFGVYDDLMPVLSMALGAGETTLLRLVTAYSMIANGGREVRATLIDRIQDRHGKTIWRHDDRECVGCKAESWQGQPEPELPDARRQIIDPHTAYQITSIMEGVVKRGTARRLGRQLRGIPLAGKTGTTNDEKDAWFIGFTADLVVGVFVGYDIPKSMGKGSTGGHLAAPIFKNFMKKALAGKPRVPFRIPAGLKLIRVNSKTGLRSSGGSSILEAFKPDEGPDDAYSFIGFEGEQVGIVQGSNENKDRPRRRRRPRTGGLY